MKALILVGGFGTRLRPLTFSMPNPVSLYFLIDKVSWICKQGYSRTLNWGLIKCWCQRNYTSSWILACLNDWSNKRYGEEGK